MKNKGIKIISRVSYGPVLFDKGDKLDINLVSSPNWWLVIFTLVIFATLIVISPLLFKIIALFVLLAIMAS